MILGGYFMDFATARTVAAKLQIDISEGREDVDMENACMEYPINSWLHDNGKLDIKAAVIPWPLGSDVEGLMIISSFLKANSGSIQESGKDEAVKEWLVENGADPARLQWASLRDNLNIMLNGIQPKRRNYKFQTVTPEEHCEMLRKSTEETRELKRIWGEKEHFRRM